MQEWTGLLMFLKEDNMKTERPSKSSPDKQDHLKDLWKSIEKLNKNKIKYDGKPQIDREYDET